MGTLCFHFLNFQKVFCNFLEISPHFILLKNEYSAKRAKSECCGELKKWKCCSKNDVENPKSARGHWCYKTWCCGYIFKKKFERLRKLSKNGK